MLLDNLANKINKLCGRIVRLEKGKGQPLANLEFKFNSPLTFPANSALKFGNVRILQNLELVDNSDIVVTTPGLYRLDILNGYATAEHTDKVTDTNLSIIVDSWVNVKAFRENPSEFSQEQTKALARGVITLRTYPHYTHSFRLKAGDAIALFVENETTFETDTHVVNGTILEVPNPEFRVMVQGLF